MTLQTIRAILDQAQELESICSIYFEGGEPFLYYPILVRAVQMASHQGYEVGLVSNAYWATSEEDALEWLKPFAGLLCDLSVSSDLFHYNEVYSQQARAAEQAARQLGLPVGVITVAQPDSAAQAGEGQIALGESGVMYRGRAAVKLAPSAAQHPWDSFTTCPYEDLLDPGRVHIDPAGNLHLCQGLLIGNLFQNTLKEICDSYQPEAHPVVGPLLAGGPRWLVEQYHLPHQESYADACHECYSARLLLRERYPALLAPDQVYGVVG
jgi:hypothetical protein